MTALPIAIGALKMVPKGLEKGLENLEIRGQEETIQTTNRPEYSKGTWKHEEIRCRIDSSERPSANAVVKK